MLPLSIQRPLTSKFETWTKRTAFFTGEQGGACSLSFVPWSRFQRKLGPGPPGPELSVPVDRVEGVSQHPETAVRSAGAGAFPWGLCENRGTLISFGDPASALRALVSLLAWVAAATRGGLCSQRGSLGDPEEGMVCPHPTPVAVGPGETPLGWPPHAARRAWQLAVWSASDQFYLRSIQKMSPPKNTLTLWRREGRAGRLCEDILGFDEACAETPISLRTRAKRLGRRLSGDSPRLPCPPLYVFTNRESKSSCWEELLPDDIMGKENTLY